MKPQTKSATLPKQEWLPGAFAGLFGAFLGLSLLKFGNPPIMEKWVTKPSDIYEFLLGYPWPITWAYRLLFVVGVFGLLSLRPKLTAPGWVVVLPLAWLVWQTAATVHTLDSQLSMPTLKHFGACVVCFYLGLFSLVWARPRWPFWLGLCSGFLLVLVIGWEQRFGGLEQSREYFKVYVYPTLTEIPPEYLKKIMSNRIWSTLFYPNTLAGAILLLMPAVIGLIAAARQRFTTPARWFLGAAIGLSGLACLYWSGSKGGWLLMLLLGLITLLRLPMKKSAKIGLLSVVLLMGMTGFFWKYSAFFKKGATSVSARFDYWRAAVETIREQPLLGTGPGTFAIPYARIKRPESEMSRLVHNDYLEQASDSGLPGLVLYGAFIVGALVWSFPRSKAGAECDWGPFSVWLGVLGWCMQSLFEFGLYIPALAWPAFTFLGWLLGRAKEVNESVN